MSEAAYITVDLFCPVCKYNLRGLPIDRACPECGLQINRHVSVESLADPYKERREKIIEEFDAMMEQRELMEKANVHAQEMEKREEKLLERWEQIAARAETVLSRLEKMIAQWETRP